ncbi:MAG: pectate lyase, partial [Pirellulales bacterium]
SGERRRMAQRCLILMAVVGVATAALAAGPDRYLDRPADWFAGDDGSRIADTILTHQSDLGGWPKNRDTTAAPFTGDRSTLHPTYDNSATTDELRFLARAYDATHEPRFHEAFLQGLDYVLAGQYPNGGWPQSFPPGDGYPRHITFNDYTMVRLMNFVREVGRDDAYAFVDEKRREAARRAFDRGIDCILKCQVRTDGRPTVWCAQHDEIDFRPRPARSYELVSLSGSESVGITELLMSLDDPSPQVIEAVEGAVDWFGRTRLTGIRIVSRKDKDSPRGVSRSLVNDPDAPPLWARFYEIGTNEPLIVDRDGRRRASFNDLSAERRSGYSWYSDWPRGLLETGYPAWKARLSKG